MKFSFSDTPGEDAWTLIPSRAFMSQSGKLSVPQLGLLVRYEHTVPTVIHVSVLFHVLRAMTDSAHPWGPGLSTLPGFSENIS